MNPIHVKRLVLVTGDEYENIELTNEIPEWLKGNVPDEFIFVKSDIFKVFINTSMVVSLEQTNSQLQVISS